ncbi:lantibiotic dehydratase family protein [Tenacibaculum sp. TC6]|uniref:lantibiotic dehydratase family protein n=1 Tax=Tenacibaculum sp. TC6 TaxID=3423223 RepID=UPI003D35E1A5
MKKKKNPYYFINQYCLRAPLLSLSTITSIFEDQKIDNNFLKSQWENLLMREAIFLASPYLHGELSKWYDKKLKDRLKIERLEQTFLKYVIRASTRCTPFGLFSGVNVGNFCQESKITLKSSSDYSRCTRLDMNYIVSLIDFLEKNDSIKNQLRYYPNSTIYSISNQYRYVEYKIQNNVRRYSLEGIESSPYIKTILESSKSGKSINELANILIDDEISEEEAINFINELITNQILVSELEPSVSGRESFDTLLNTLKSTKNNTIYKVLISLKTNISQLDTKKNNSKNRYISIYKDLQKIKINFDKKYALQTDLFIKTKQNNLHNKYGSSILKVLPLLCRINNHESKNKNLDQFKKRFIQRYKTREISLVQVLDIESGIGYVQNNTVSDTVPFLNDITPKVAINTSINKSKKKVHDFLHKKLLNTLNSDIQSIELSDKDFYDFELNWENFPNTFFSLVELTSIKNQDYIILNSIGGTNATNLLSRFCYGDKELRKMVEDICSLEQELTDDKVLTEIVHLPEARVGNILQRPHLRAYETPYLAKSNLPKSKQVNIDDITVSVRNNRVVLKSKSLNKEISPRLTNAHNYAYKSLPIYHFLCDMQSQNKINNFGFSWSFLQGNYPFLPRVIYKNIILHKARWYVEREEVQEIINNYDYDDKLLNMVSLWKEKRNLPKLVQLKEGDNKLLINLKNIDTVRLLLQQIKSKKGLFLEEFLMEKTAMVKRNDERFANQFVFLFGKKKN